MVLGGQVVWGLVDTRCGWILVKKARGPWETEVLQMKCIHRVICEYCTKTVEVQVLGQTFCCQVGVVLQLDCPMLIGRNYSLSRLL